MRIEYTKKFQKDWEKISESIRVKFYDRLRLFNEDKFHPLLNNHALRGRYEGYRSINVTGDWRVIFRECNFGDEIYFTDLGTHSQLYRK